MINKEKVIRQLVDFCKKAESNTTTEERRDTITNTAEEIVKLFAIPNVVFSEAECLQHNPMPVMGMDNDILYYACSECGIKL